MPERKDDCPPFAGTGRGKQALTLADGKVLHLAVLALFLVLALLLSYPLIAHFATHVPGSATWAFDEYTFVWNIWWFKRAVIDLHTSPLHTDLLFFPLGIDLILHTYNFFNALIALPLQMVMSLPAASNATLILSTVLSGYGAFLLVRYLLVAGDRGYGLRVRGYGPGETACRAAPAPYPLSLNPLISSLAAMTAGLVYAFAANRAVYAALGHYDMVTTQWLPFYALYLLKTVRADKRQCLVRNALLAGLFFTLAVLAEMIFGVFLGIFTLLVLAFNVRRLAFGVRRWNLKPVWGLMVIGVTVAVLWAPVLVPIVRQFATGEYALEGWGEAVKLSADLVGMVTPTALHPLWGGDWVRELRAVEEGTARFADVNTVFLGYATLALALLGLLRYRQQVRVWGWTALLFGLFCLGPLLQINGRYRFDLDGLEATFPLPYALLHYIPIVQANRAPNRNSVLLMLGLAVLAGFGTYFLLQLLRAKAPGAEATGRTGRRRALFVSLFSLVILFEHAAVPTPLTDARVPPVYEQIAAEPGEFAVMHLPLGWRTSFGPLGSERTQLQIYQTVHGKPIIGGNIARAPSFKMEYFRRVPLFRALADVEMYREPDAETDAAARAQAAGLMQLYDVRYLVVLPPIPGRWPYQDTYARTWQYARQVLPLESEPFYDQDGVRAYRVLQPMLTFPLEIDLGTQAAWPNRGAGWHDDEVIFGETANWAAAEAEIFFPLRELADYRLGLRIAPFSYPGATPQSLQVFLNGQPLDQPQLLSEGWQVLDVPLPAAAVRSGLNRLKLRFGRVERPRDVLPGQTAIGATGVATPVDIEIEAAADHAYISLYDEAGAKTDGSAGRRGYNVAVLDARTGRLLDKRGFDTWANEYEAQRLAEFVAQIPEGRIVVVATKDDAGQHVTAEAVAALHSLGAQGDLRGAVGQAHALIGVKGAAPGTALELVAAPNAWLRLGRNPDRRPLAAAVDWVRVER
ncbi:MAG: interleukin-like EMT inducer domain-containing protein [Anaerolineae bacterium]|nr:interleukin-like EMT inducer domain-containing protein [Anaerolineae bacterium]